MASSREWDERFRTGDHASESPDPFLETSRRYWGLLPGRDPLVSPSDPLRAIDIACGAGRHAVRLAAAGFHVRAVDFSAQALRRADGLARSRGLSIETVLQDLETGNADLGHELFDLAVVFFYLHRPLFPVLKKCLKPGGLLVYKTYSVDQLRHPGGPRNRMYMLEHNELLNAFSGFRVLRYEEEWEEKGTAALIAQKYEARPGPD